MISAGVYLVTAIVLLFSLACSTGRSRETSLNDDATKKGKKSLMNRLHWARVFLGNARVVVNCYSLDDTDSRFSFLPCSSLNGSFGGIISEYFSGISSRQRLARESQKAVSLGGEGG